MQSLAGSLVGVTSHITPLPAGEGKGEGPLSYGFEKTIVYLLPMVRMDTETG